MIFASVELEEAQEEERGIGLHAFCAIRQKIWIPFLVSSTAFFAATERDYTYSAFTGGAGEPRKVNLSDYVGLVGPVQADVPGTANSALYRYVIRSDGEQLSNDIVSSATFL